MNHHHRLTGLPAFFNATIIVRFSRLFLLLFFVLPINAFSQINFATQVAPLFSGNGGCASINVCHGNFASGGLKLNGDVDEMYAESVTEVGDRGRRRVDLSNLPNSAVNSLILVLPAGQTPPGEPGHGGGTRTDWSVGQSAYNTTLQWIREGAFRFLAPTNFVASAASPTQISLVWTDRSEGESGFRIERRIGAGNFTFFANVGANTQNFIDNTASPNTSYTYRVRAENAVGTSDYTSSGTVTTPSAAPNPPSNLRATTVSTTQIDLQWNDNSDNETGFRLERKIETGAFSLLIVKPAGSTSHSDVGLTAGTTYTYRVRAEGSPDNSAFSNEATATTNRPPQVVNAIANQNLTVGGAPFTRNLNAAPAVFGDPDGDPLTYTASSSAANVALASISGSTLTVAAVAAGNATIMVNADDGRGGTASTTFAIIVAGQAPRTVRLIGITASAGGAAEMPIELLAQGNENALGFSLIFDTAVLSNPQARLGRDGGNAILNVNISQQAQGRFGVALALPTGQSFSAGTRELVVVSFSINAATPARTTTIDFGNQPIVQEASDVNANTLPVVWTPATLIITSVESRTNGVPASFELGQNYPNPILLGAKAGAATQVFTTIQFSLPKSGQVILKVYNLLGVEVAILMDKPLVAGRYQAQWDVSRMKSGIYYYRLQAGAFVKTRKLVVMQ